jgi:hypothetical protein
LRLEAALQEEIAHAFDEFFKVDSVGWFSGVFSVADEFHGRRSLSFRFIRNRSLVAMLLGMTTLRRFVS